MIPAPIPVDEDQRLQALRRYCVLDTQPEPAFDRLTQIAQHLLDVPTVLVSLIDCDRQWFKARIGLDAAETPRTVSFCGHAVYRKQALIVPDALLDERFADNPLVVGAPGVRFYVGAPLVTAKGYALGTLCAIDYVPRSAPTEEQVATLTLLADCVVDALELRQSVQEIAERERALSENSDLLQSTMDAVGQGIASFDADLILIARNAKFSELLDLPPDLDRIGTSFESISACVAARGGYGAGSVADWVAARKTAVRSGEPYSLEIVRPGGRITEVRGYPVLGGGRVTTYTDITEQRQLADELRKRLAEREQIASLKNEFVAVVSHELRTPLTSISGSLELLDGGVGGPLPPDAKEMVGVAFHNSERLIKLVNDILDIEKIESGRVTFEIEPCPLAPLIERAVSETAPYGDNLHVHFELHTPAKDAMALVDSDRFIQVVTNLLSNAAKFSPKDGTVTVALVRGEGGLRVSVTDCGSGIPEEFQQRIFEKFAQADGADNRRLAGSGLGLAIVKNIVDRLGGTVSFETQEGRGTTFFVDLPEWYVSDSATEALHVDDDPVRNPGNTAERQTPGASTVR
jgi:signal transduction histidine kinase